MVASWWIELEHKFSHIKLDEHIIMPNHIHGIIVISDKIVSDQIVSDQIVGADLCVCPETGAHPEMGAHPKMGAHTGAPLRVAIGDMVRWFKTMTTNQYIKNIKNNQ